MIGTIVNTFAVITGGIIGLFLKNKMPSRLKNIYFQGIGLFTLAIGIHMSVNMQKPLFIVISIAVGSIIGECIDIEKSTEHTSELLKTKLNIGDEKFSDGLITSFLVFCVGSMTIIGTIQEGTGGSPDLLLTKSLMDFFSAILLAEAFGTSVVFSALPLFIFQATLTFTAMFASNFLTDDIILGLTNVGGILLIGLSLNILEIKKIRVMNMLPSLLLIILLLWVFS
ncbi:MAG: DUF554 domain-containing protein [Fermentimonas sp.]|jgi:uncharacterized membrane protein YqgA involved in biofilm formation